MGRDRNKPPRRRGSSTSRQGADGEAISASGVLDLFTDVDDLLREVNETLTSMDDTLGSVSDNQVALGNVLNRLTEEDADLPSRIDRPLVDDETVQQGETVENDIEVPKDGRLTQVYLSFPEGANQSLGIGVRGVNEESLVPFGPKGHKFIALDDRVVSFDLDYRVEKGEKLSVEYVNNRPVDEEGYLTAILVVTEGA